MEAVEDQPEVRLVGPPHQVPGLLPGVHLAPPGQRLVADAQAADGGALGQLPEVIGQQRRFAEGIGSDVAAHQHQVGAEFLHQVELAFGALQISPQAFPAAALEVAERLEQQDLQAQVGTQPAYVARAAVVMKQVVLEDFHPVETGGGDGLELFRQGAAQDTVAIERCMLRLLNAPYGAWRRARAGGGTAEARIARAGCAGKPLRVAETARPASRLLVCANCRATQNVRTG